MDLRSAAEVVVGQLVLLLLEVDLPNTVPGVVMARVQPQCVPVAPKPFVKVLRGHVLVPAERVGVHELRVELQGALEEAQGGLVLTLEAEAVAQNAPSLRREPVKRQSLMR